ncbi:substrate-binding domain-containing protein [Actinoplanes solisilvae]|uniref:substrate-binding domain-containing protein n=1 Tax=Actinoplanes solisilvae TaxID=2486853 RepID=UPI001F0C67EA
MAVIGYDDIEDGRYGRPTISTISPDKGMIARTAVERLVLRMATPDSVPGVELRAAHRLIARESTLGRTWKLTRAGASPRPGAGATSSCARGRRGRQCQFRTATCRVGPR